MRIVSLCPSLTELVFDLGRGGDLVGVTEWCVHPAAGVAGIEKVGGTKTPRVARIVELAPDLVLMNAEENRAEDATALERAGLALHITMPRTAEETAAMVRSIGAAVDRGEAAEAIAADIEARAARVRRQAAARPALAYAGLIWRKPWISFNADTFVHGLLELAGGRNVFADRAERYPEIGLDELAAARPRAVFLLTEPFPFDARHADEIAAETGLARHTLHVVDGELLTWHGSRTPDGIVYAARAVEAAR